MNGFSSSRDFQIWDYYISLSQLLLRSVPDEGKGEQENIDIIFKGVFYLDIPATLSGIEIDTPTGDELTRLQSRAGTQQDAAAAYYKYFVLVSKGRRFYIGAFGMSIETNTLGMLETSLGVTYQVAE